MNPGGMAGRYLPADRLAVEFFVLVEERVDYGVDSMQGRCVHV
jgi:hypothetical protein